MSPPALGAGAVVTTGRLDARAVESEAVGRYMLGDRELTCGSSLDVLHGDTWIRGRVEHRLPHGYYWLVTVRARDRLGSIELRAWLCDIAAAGITCRTGDS